LHYIERGYKTKWEKKFYTIKWIEYSVPLQEIWQILKQLINKGDITYTGTCNFAEQRKLKA
jgi:aryl-alcohol dehydrogenase-like predicted oxidoreductase